MLYKLRSGEDIEFGYGSNLPPGAKGGQHVGMTYTWWRVPNGEWEHASSRSLARTMKIADISDSIDEFRQLQEIE